MEFLTLKKSNCRNCYKCIRHCPVKAIRFSGNQAYIIGNECVMCGHCFVVCPQNAKQIADSTEDVKYLISTGAPVVASLAPSFIANYDGVGIGAMREALKKLGFFDVEETALGATVVKCEYERILNEESRDVVITSCCHSVNLLIQKHFPKLIPCLADVVSPMQAHCKDIKRRIPDAKTVFIGPCISKKDEADHYKGIVDAALTFEELTSWLKAENIKIKQKKDSSEKSKARLFPTAGGILRTMDLDNSDYDYLFVDGMENCIASLKDIEAGNVHKCFIEMSACVGSCIGGPIMEKYHPSPIKDTITVNRYAGRKDFDVEQPEKSELAKIFEEIEQTNKMPTEDEIVETLHQMGKHQPDDELNCGSCGYNTCREKAVAILQGKAEISMCMPYLKDKAENLSNTIARNTPNGLIVLNEKLEVQQINTATKRILNLRSEKDILGDHVVRVLEPKDFEQVLSTGRPIRNKREFLAEYERYVEKTIVYDRDFKVLIGILRDITDEEQQRERKEEISRQTVEIADKVVDKQMRIVQEIASLLGETAAETKIALTKLKESISDE
ncbi:MAG: histidine kinase [Lachnospiraceae bacterium]|nr:histidine kinase [Lachnospiraceae bacterium]